MIWDWICFSNFGFFPASFEELLVGVDVLWGEAFLFGGTPELRPALCEIGVSVNESVVVSSAGDGDIFQVPFLGGIGVFGFSCRRCDTVNDIGLQSFDGMTGAEFYPRVPDSVNSPPGNGVVDDGELVGLPESCLDVVDEGGCSVP
ncbi:MAG: hypothetical protein RIT02_2707 [Planctomycetota bacterium]